MKTNKMVSTRFYSDVSAPRSARALSKAWDRCGALLLDAELDAVELDEALDEAADDDASENDCCG